MLKADLRQLYKARRAGLSAHEVTLFSEQITRRFFTDDRIAAVLARPGATVHTYLPIQKQNEVDTWPLIHQLWRSFPEVRVWSSVTEPASHTLAHFQLTADLALTETRWGIPVPSGPFVPVSGSPDLVLVPLLACDWLGNRVGYGGGYYDRFLAGVGADCLKVGVSLFQLAEAIDDMEPTDVRLDGCVSPDQIYWF